MSEQQKPVDEPTTERVIVIDGVEHSPDDFTFRELRDLRSSVRELSGNPEATVQDVAWMDYFPAVAYVIKRRTDPSYTLEQALDLKESDVIADRPTKPDAGAVKATARRGGAGARATS